MDAEAGKPEMAERLNEKELNCRLERRKTSLWLGCPLHLAIGNLHLPGSLAEGKERVVQ